MQKTIHRWKRRGLNDSTITRLLDLYLGIPAYMDAQCVYPLCNFYDIRLSLRFAYTATLLAAITNCQSFGLIWDDTHTKIIAFYSPLWYRKEETPQDSPQDSAQKTPQDSAQDSPQDSAQKTPQDSAQKTPQDSAQDNNILYNIIIYIPRRGILMKPYYSLSDFPDRKSAGKNFIARCPQCDTTHLYILKAKGLYHCFYAGCGSSGILTDYCKNQRPFFTYPKNSGAGTRLHPSGRAESARPGAVQHRHRYYIRQPCGRYDEHESGEECCECD